MEYLYYVFDYTSYQITGPFTLKEAIKLWSERNLFLLEIGIDEEINVISIYSPIKK